MMRYHLKHQKTQAATGFFAPVPAVQIGVRQALDYVQAHPFDSFMRHQLLARIRQDPADFLEAFQASEREDPVLSAFFCEAAVLFGLADLKDILEDKDLSKLARQTPLIYLKSAQLPDQSLHQDWMRLFHANYFSLAPLPPPEKVPFESPFSISENIGVTAAPSVSNPSPAMTGERESPAAKTFDETIEMARNALARHNVDVEGEMRHQSSLSPIGLLRHWSFEIEIDCDRHCYRFGGKQTAYGRGFSLSQARAACLMEVVERYSAYVCVRHRRLPDLSGEPVLRLGTYTRLCDEGCRVLNPNSLQLEVPYQNEKLYWIEGRQQTGAEEMPVLVPFQAVCLFANLDEPDLFSAVGSTGLAAGNTMAEARLAALLECIERDADAVTPFAANQVFHLVAHEPPLGPLLRDYRQRGIQMAVQDLSAAAGVPAFRALVKGGDGQAARGTGAHPDARRALASAITEVPYPYPDGPPGVPFPDDTPFRRLDTFPDNSRYNPVDDLAQIEAQLSAAGHFPVYVDLTRTDLAIPVVRAIVPGRETMADFDFSSRVSPRLFSYYLRFFEQPGRALL